MQRTALTTLAAFSIIFSAIACDVEYVDVDAMPRGNHIDATMDGMIFSQALSGRVDRSQGDYGQNHIWASIEAQEARGVMTYFNLFGEDDSLENLESGTVYAYNIDNEDVILGEDGDQYFRTDGDTTTTPTPSDVMVDVGECDGANIDMYDEDVQVDNVAFTIEDCTACEDQEASPRTVRYMAWPTGRLEEAVYAEFTVEDGEMEYTDMDNAVIVNGVEIQ